MLAAATDSDIKMEKRRWYSVAETAEISGISASKLWSLKGDGLLVVGKHWVYLSGKKIVLLVGQLMQFTHGKLSNQSK
jgi:hypothetical protein